MMYACVSVCVGRPSVCYSDMLTADIHQCVRDMCVPRSSVRIGGTLLEGKWIVSVSLCPFPSNCPHTHTHIDIPQLTIMDRSAGCASVLANYIETAFVHLCCGVEQSVSFTQGHCSATILFSESPYDISSLGNNTFSMLEVISWCCLYKSHSSYLPSLPVLYSSSQNPFLYQ